jgi:hypothetical protein
VLQHQQPVVEELVDLAFCYYTEDAAHDGIQALVIVDVLGEIVW